MRLKPKKLSDEERINWIRLARTYKIGPAMFFRILEIFPEVNEAIKNLPEFVKSSNLRCKSLKICDKKTVEREIEKTHKFGAEILTFLDEDYPRMVREIYDPAPVLVVKGEKKFLNEGSLAMVGPRNASFHACKFAEKMAEDLARREIVVVSGLARGIDAAAHRGGFGYGTVAVIAGGINDVYPAENRKLFERMAKEGVLVSEHPFGAPPKARNFIQRNRIVSGMSYGVIVVEAGMQSGSIATARFALDQGREVFAVPGFPTDPRTQGSNFLIEEGAIFTTGSERIFKEMGRLRMVFDESGKLKEPEEVEFVPPPVKMPSEGDISKVRDEIASRIGFVAMPIEELIQEVGVPARMVNIALVQLELADRVVVSYGRVVRK